MRASGTPSPALCRRRGSGARSKRDFATCPVCSGRGVVVKKIPFRPGYAQHVQMECDRCKGSGKIVTAFCPVCKGRRTLKGTHSLTVEVEKVWNAGCTS